MYHQMAQIFLFVSTLKVPVLDFHFMNNQGPQLQLEMSLMQQQIKIWGLTNPKKDFYILFH